MKNLLYGLKLKDKKMYVEDIEIYNEKQEVEIAYQFERDFAKSYEYETNANRIRRLAKDYSNIDLEVIVLRERV